MNYTMVKRLILKDWYLYRWMVLFALPAGALTLAVIAAMGAGQLSLTIGIIVMATILIAWGRTLRRRR